MGGGDQTPPQQNETLVIALPDPEPVEQLAALQKRYPWVRVEYHQIAGWGAALPAEAFANATTLVTGSTFPARSEDAPNLRWLHLMSAGSNQVQGSWIWANDDILITTSSGIHGPQISEWVLMALLVRTHHYDQFHDAQKAHRWEKYRPGQTVRDLAGQRIGVLGYGSIGRQVGRVAKAMGMDVIAYTAHAKDTPESRADNGYIVPGTGDRDGSIPSAWYSGLSTTSLHHFLAQDIDVLLVSVPSTNATRHFLGAAEFDVLARGSNGTTGHKRTHAPYLVNISRGQNLNQPDLLAALEDGTLAGAALDVTDPEPLPADDPLWGAPNTTITPHISAVTTDYTSRSLEILTENVGRRARGDRLWNVVDRKRGY
ncbi:2-hydroxyacid dehydrogenase [Phyllosticta capitalensis]|uniref:2-hydroxyacid dehydrogenase n=2 Tax=Phyllosticta capitalensis TaxID=121624 RepID=A0ABR1YEA1_9PEZI